MVTEDAGPTPKAEPPRYGLHIFPQHARMLRESGISPAVATLPGLLGAA